MQRDPRVKGREPQVRRGARCPGSRPARMAAIAMRSAPVLGRSNFRYWSVARVCRSVAHSQPAAPEDGRTPSADGLQLIELLVVIAIRAILAARAAGAGARQMTGGRMPKQQQLLWPSSCIGMTTAAIASSGPMASPTVGSSGGSAGWAMAPGARQRQSIATQGVLYPYLKGGHGAPVPVAQSTPWPSQVEGQPAPSYGYGYKLPLRSRRRR